MKRIMIVGATSGIGEGLARRYAEEGQVKVGIMGRRAGRLKGLCRLRPEVFEAEVCDVTDLERVEASLERLAARMGGLDLLILSAGTGDLNPLLDYGVERAALETNVLGWTCVADWAVRRFERQGRGHLAAITSAGGLRGSGAAPAYSATKNLPVCVTDQRPGFVDTAMAKGEGLFWVASVEEACRHIMRGIARRKDVVYVTRRWRLVAWFYRRIPGWLFKRMQG